VGVHQQIVIIARTLLGYLHHHIREISVGNGHAPQVESARRVLSIHLNIVQIRARLVLDLLDLSQQEIDRVHLVVNGATHFVANRRVLGQLVHRPLAYELVRMQCLLALVQHRWIAVETGQYGGVEEGEGGSRVNGSSEPRPLLVPGLAAILFGCNVED